MNNDPSLRVEGFYRKTRELLSLKEISKGTGYSKKLGQFSSSKGSFPVQIWGKREIRALEKLAADGRREFLKRKLEDNPSCIVLADNLSFFPEIENEAQKKNLALFRSEYSRKKAQERIKKFFLSLEAKERTISAGLLQIFGLGVLIMGDSGIGKSESALELITRGHRFVSDDAVRLKRDGRGKLMGRAPSLSRNFMEIRGLGLINIKEIFSSKIVLPKTKIDLAIRLKKWQPGKEYDRIGLESPEDYMILGEKIPLVNIPVGPGRNMATLIEVACKVHLLRRKGYLAPKELVKKIDRALTQSS
jgi:HPr kinase/phosphorylase